MRTLTAAVILGGLVVLMAGAYAPTLGNGFVYEDAATILENPQVQMLAPIELHKPRALTELSWRVDFWRAGLSAGSYHQMNVFLHLVNGLLVFWLALKWLPKAGALAAVGVFWLHPLQVEAVAYVTGRSELLSTGCALIACLALLREEWRWFHVLVGGLAIVAALSAKETSIAILGVMACYGVVMDTNWPKRGLALLAIPLVLAVGAMSIRILFTDVPAVGMASRGHLAYAATQASALWAYGGRLFLPLGLTIDHDFETVPMWINAGALLALIGLAWLISRLRAAAPLLCVACAWPLVTLSPRFIMRIPEYLNEHQLYLPMVGIALVVGWGWSRLLEWSA